MIRITRHQMFMQIAEVVARRSTCFRLNVGAVIVHDNRIVSIGYNGTPSGSAHCAGNACPGRKPGACPTIHAEKNALAYVPASLVESQAELHMYVTDSPCMDCAELLTATHPGDVHNAFPNVTRVYFRTAYRDLDPVKTLTVSGVQVYQLTPAGFLIDKDTGWVIENPCEE